ncbi:uncharacterized protein LOC113291403 [Papaver somniferum]|uniref:uncharacterized protein LOC113291403 n=1 Tax=Papaver somniferum TaxID=3469 RepID=UPI000E701DD2|nr:uncharacterized protein LOC113291403 [Papaver somniferum]
MSICAACNSPDHLVDSFPEILAFQESKLEQDNALYHKQENNTYSQTYNPGWRNYPNFSWSKGPVQGGTPGNIQGYSYPRNPQMQSYTQHPSEKKLSSIEESVGLLTQNLLQNQNTTDQRFTSLELKMGQICDALNEREKGKFPSQPQQNPKGTFKASTSTCNETAHAVTTLRSGKVVDNNVGIPHTSESESDPSLQQNKSTHYNEMLEMFKRVNINIPFLEAIKQIPAYAKFLKDLCTQKRKLNVHKRAFLDKQLGLRELKPTPITLQLADRSVKVPRGVVEDVLIKVDNQHPMNLDNNDVYEINMIESLVQDSLSNTLSVDPLQACMENFNLDLYDAEYICEVHSLLESVPHTDITKWQTKVEPLPPSDSKSVPSLVEPPKLELKPLPDTLKYAFLGSSNTLPIIISSALDINT